MNRAGLVKSEGICRRCSGRGILPGSHYHGPQKCWLCKGTGTVVSLDVKREDDES